MESPDLSVNKKRVIEYNSLSKVYHTEGRNIIALQNITFDVHESDFVTVVGPSGCGKTTLLKITAGLLSPSSGDVRVNGRLIASPTPDVGLVFQTPVLLPWNKTIDNVLLPIRILRLSVKEYHEQALALLSLVGLKGFEDRYPFELSIGMQQRVALARAMMYDPTVLLMDEPFASLDALTRKEMNLELLRIWREKSKSVLLVTHDISEAVFLADYVVILTPRPSSVVKILKIDLSRPRDRQTGFKHLFVEYVQAVYETLQDNDRPQDRGQKSVILAK